MSSKFEEKKSFEFKFDWTLRPGIGRSIPRRVLMRWLRAEMFKCCQ